MEKIAIFDTTLRDGEQAPGFSMGVDQKVKMAIQLKKLNVDVIEAGFPISSGGDFNAVSEIARRVKGPEIAGLARASKKDITRAWEALKYARHPRIHIFIATSPIHMKYKLRMEPDEVYERAVNGVKFARKFTDNIEFSAEDATRSNPKFLIRILTGVVKAGARVINIPDTVGYATPDEFSQLIQLIKSSIKNVILSVHCHNDLGLASANSLSAIKSGARQVECTINGIGERAGNAALEEIVMALKIRKKSFNCKTDIDTTQLYPTSRLLSLITGVEVQPNKAIVGKNAFAHEAGIHQDGILKEQTTYEIIRPADIGLPSNSLILGKHSGRHAFISRIKALGYEFTQEQLDTLFIKFKRLADKKKEIYNEDLEELIAEEFYRIPRIYHFESANFASGSDMIPVATVQLKVNKKSYREVGWGDGAVDAVYNAIRKLTKRECRLVHFHISSITKGSDAQGKVTVQIEESGQDAIGQAVHTDIVIASAKAFVQALNRLDMKKKIR